ncbi:MAG: hypothetical protein ABIT96_13220 [Ferruginibacter sp.]
MEILKFHTFLKIKLNQMQHSLKNLSPLRWLAIILFSCAVFVACESKKTDNMESNTTESMKMNDTLPALDSDTLIKDRPETIKNTN